MNTRYTIILKLSEISNNSMKKGIGFPNTMYLNDVSSNNPDDIVNMVAESSSLQVRQIVYTYILMILLISIPTKFLHI